MNLKKIKLRYTLIYFDGSYETNKTKLKMVCKNIYQYNYKENYIGYIDEAYLKIIKIDNEKYICFATDKEEP